MKSILVIICLNLGFCASIQNEWRIQSAISDWNIGRAQWKKEFKKEIDEVPEFADLP